MGKLGSLADVLVGDQLLSAEYLEQARQVAEHRGSPLVGVLLEQSLISEDALLHALRRRLHGAEFDPASTPVDPEALRMVPYEEATRYGLLPLQLDQHSGQRVMSVAMIDPLDQVAIGQLEDAIGAQIAPLLARASQLYEAIQVHYRGIVTKVIQRPPQPGQGPRPPSLQSRREPFGGALASAQLDTGQLDTVQPSASAAQRVEALVRLLIRSGAITRDEYEDELHALLDATRDS